MRETEKKLKQMSDEDLMDLETWISHRIMTGQATGEFTYEEVINEIEIRQLLGV